MFERLGTRLSSAGMKKVAKWRKAHPERLDAGEVARVKLLQLVTTDRQYLLEF